MIELEFDSSILNRFVAINVTDFLIEIGFYCPDFGVGILRHLLGFYGLLIGCTSFLIYFIGFGLNGLNSGLGPAVNILNGVLIPFADLGELINSTTHGINLLLNILLGGATGLKKQGQCQGRTE